MYGQFLVEELSPELRRDLQAVLQYKGDAEMLENDTISLASINDALNDPFPFIKRILQEAPASLFADEEDQI